MRGFSRRGIILGIVLLTTSMLAVFLFAYNYTVRRQNIRAHHEQIGEVGATLAKTGVGLLFEEIGSGFDSMILAAAPTLVGSVLSTNFLTVDSSDVSGSVCQKVRNDFDKYLSQLAFLSGGNSANAPRCIKMEVAFESIQQLNPILPTDTPDQIRLRLQAGRDPVEKSGEAVVSCTVEYRHLRRKASIKRQFRVVSMVPGPFARFSLFVPYTPYANSYNALGVNFNGTIDATYQHPHPNPQHFSGGLKIINGTDSYVVGTMPNPKKDLQNRGWVFLGPAYDPPTNATSAVILRLPSGYSNQGGGHFLFSMPKVQNGIEIVNTEQIDTALYNPSPNATTSVLMGGTFQGFYTNSLNTIGVQTGINTAKQGVWATLDPARPWECASSYLMPYGDRNSPSRTLVIGPVLGGFLKFYFLKEGIPSPTWGFILKGTSEASYTSSIQVQAADQPTPLQSPNYIELYKPTGGESKPGLRNFIKTMPFTSVPQIAMVPLSEGVAFNAFFDFCEYNVGNYPLYHEGSQVMQSAVANEFFVPGHARMTTPTPPATVKGIHPWDDVKIKFDETDGPVPNDNLYFQGDLTSVEFNDLNLLGRITHVIDLIGAADLAQENQMFRDLLFYKSLPAGVPGGGWWLPRKPGVFLVRRRAGFLPSEKLKLPGKVFLDKPLIIIVSAGHLSIPDIIRSTPMPLPVGGCPENLFTLVALDGNIYLGTSGEIHAYLVALKRPPITGRTGGKLLSEGGVVSMNIFGGLAIAEMGLYPTGTDPTTMGNFPGGGLIRYNPRFNPNSPLYALSRRFIIEDKHSSIAVTGAD